MLPTRRQFLLTSMGGITAAAGCSRLTDPERELLLAVNNYSDVPREGFVTIDRDGTNLVRQYVEVGAADEDDWKTVETLVSLGKMSTDTQLDVTASFGDGLETNGTITLDCAETSRYEGDMIAVQLDAEGDLYFSEWCYDKFPSDEARQGEINRS